MSQRLEHAISRFRRLPADGGREESARVSAAAFRVAIETHSLERDIGELKGRLSALIFVVIGTVITQLLLKVGAVMAAPLPTLRTYQAEAGRAIVDSVLNRRGLAFTVVIAGPGRQERAIASGRAVDRLADVTQELSRARQLPGEPGARRPSSEGSALAAALGPGAGTSSGTQLKRKRYVKEGLRMRPAAVSEIRTEDVEQLMMPVSPPKSRARHSSLPEYTRYHDDGCDISESCLTCPLPRCRYEEPGGLRALLNETRDRQIIQLRLKGVPVEELAGRFGISRRTVFRVIGSTKLPARVRRVAYDTTPIPIRREQSTVQPRKEAHCA